MSPVNVIQDLRWGDTGKGKLSEYLSQPERCGVSVRAIGGGNAGHVIMLGTRKIALHLLPAGCVHPGVDLVMGRGMVTHIPTLLDELDKVENQFQSDPLSRLHVAGGNHILFDAHKMADAELEKRRNKPIGTTHSGIGPAYADKALRVGMRFEELKGSPDSIKDRYRKLLSHWAKTYGVALDSEQQGKDEYSLLHAKEVLEERIVSLRDYWTRIFSEIEQGQKRGITIEGAQGSLLSVDGDDDYPNVTASATTVLGHLQGAGLPHNVPKYVIGTLKAYDTCVGTHNMRTKLEGDAAKKLREKGNERGSTTNRERDVGDLDLESTAEKAAEEGVDGLGVFKLDIFNDYKVIRFATGTKANGEPEYTELPGWEGSITGINKFQDLPENAQNVYRFIEQRTGKPVVFGGTGPESTQLFVRFDA